MWQGQVGGRDSLSVELPVLVRNTACHPLKPVLTMVFHDYVDAQRDVYPLEEGRVDWESNKRQSDVY